MVMNIICEISGVVWQNEIVWIIVGQVCICVQSMWQSRGVWGHAPLGNFDFGPFIRHNLMKSGTVFSQT